MFSPIAEITAIAAPVIERLTSGRRSDFYGAHQFDNRIRYDLRGLPRRVVADPRQYAALIRAGEERRVLFRRFRRMDAVGFALQGNRRNRDLRLRGKPLLDRFQRRVTRRISEPMTVGLYGHCDKIGIVE